MLIFLNLLCSWQNHCCVMSTNLQQCVDETQANFSYPRRPHSSLDIDSSECGGSALRINEGSDRYPEHPGLLPGSSAEVIFDGASSTTTLLRAHSTSKTACVNNSQTNGNPNRMFVGPERII